MAFFQKHVFYVTNLAELVNGECQENDRIDDDEDEYCRRQKQNVSMNTFWLSIAS